MAVRSRQKIWVFFMLVLSLSLVMLYKVPIKWTPVKYILSSYPNWHPLTTVQLVEILRYPLPEGVIVLDHCPRVRPHSITDSVLNGLNITFYSYSKVERALFKLTQEEQNDLRPFLPLLDIKTKRTLVRAYMVLKEALDRVRVDSIILHGPLLGFYRFAGIIPWDDDVDIGIMVEHWLKVREALSCVEGYELMVDSNMRWSFFPSDGEPSSAMAPKKYPFIDIIFYANDAEHIWSTNRVARHAGIFRMEHMFPLKPGVFEGIKVWVPYDPEAILKSEYRNLDQCLTQPYGHLRELKGHFEVVCSKLYPLYGRFPRQKITP